MSEDWDVAGFVISSRYRVLVMRRLWDGPASPSTIASESSVAISHVSRALGELREHSLVHLLVPEDRRKGRLYGLTDRGEEVWEHMQEEGLV